jgi:hypothetical protein
VFREHLARGKKRETIDDLIDAWLRREAKRNASKRIKTKNE